MKLINKWLSRIFYIETCVCDKYAVGINVLIASPSFIELRFLKFHVYIRIGAWA